MTREQLFASVLLSGALCGPAIAQPASESQPEPAVELNIASQPLDRALNEWASQTGYQVLIPAHPSASDRAAPRVKGVYTPQSALGLLLARTEFSYQLVNSRTVAIRVAHDEVSPATQRPSVPEGSFRLAQAQPSRGSPATDAPPSAGERKQAVGSMEEVVVTAQKRAERLQDTAMSLSALSNRDIEQQGLQGMGDYLRSVPGVSHLDQGVGRNSTVIRGISVDPGGEGLSVGQTVGVYFGEVPLSGLRWSAADIKLVDMERVEVLRGPQGTLYGAGSLSGAIRNIPVAPDLFEFDGTVEAGYSNTSGNGGGSNELKGVINLPLSAERFAVRLVGYRFKDTGYVDNVAGSDPAFFANAALYGAQPLAIDQDDVGNAEYTGGRITALWRMTDELSATLTYLAQNTEQNGLPEVELSTGGYSQTRLQMGDVIGGGPEKLIDDTDVTNLVVTYDFAAASLVSSSSYSEQKFHRNYDIGVFFGGIPVPQIYLTESEGFSEELRLVSRLEGPFQFVAGLYYEDLKFSTLSQSFFGGAPAFNPFGSDALLFNFSDDTSLRQQAAFGEVSYNLTRQLRLTVGARKFDYDRSTRSLGSGALAGVASDATVEGEEGDTSYKANVTFTPVTGTLLYAQWSQGFRLGKPLAQFPSTCDLDSNGLVDGIDGVPVSGARLNSDYLDSYELGGKFSFLNDRFIVNAAVYQIDWTGLPISVIPPCLSPVFVNAGEAQSRGVELESWFYLARNLRLNVAASLVRAELNGDAPSIGEDGDRLPGSPREQYSAGLQYSFDAGGYPTYVRGEYAYVGSFYNRPGETGVKAGGYGTLNANFGMTFNQFELSVFGRNLTNSDAVSWADSVFTDGRAFRLRPRTFGVNATIHF